MNSSQPSAVSHQPDKTEHCDHDFDMEVLTFLPRAPGYALVGHIAVDLHTLGQRPVADALRRLKMEYAVVVGNDPGGMGRVAWIKPAGWQKAKDACMLHLGRSQPEN